MISNHAFEKALVRFLPCELATDGQARSWIRWIAKGKADVLLSLCGSCDWSKYELVLTQKEDRIDIAKVIQQCQHWYSCPAKADLKFALPLSTARGSRELAEDLEETAAECAELGRWEKARDLVLMAERSRVRAEAMLRKLAGRQRA